MRKILAVYAFFAVACGQNTENKPAITELKPKCQAQITPAASVTVQYGAVLGFGAPNNGFCTQAFVVLDPSGSQLAVIGPSGAETAVVVKISGTYQVKYLADNSIVGSVVITVLPPPEPKVNFSQSFTDSLLLNTEVRISYKISNCSSISSLLVPGTPQSADPKTEKIVFSVSDSILKTGSTMPVGKWQQNLLLVCTGLDGLKADTAKLSFFLRVPKMDVDSLSPRVAFVGIWGTHCFYSKSRAFVSNNGVDFKGTVSGGSRYGIPTMDNMITNVGYFQSPEKFCHGYFPGWNGETVEYVANRERSEGPYPDAEISPEKLRLFTITVKDK